VVTERGICTAKYDVASVAYMYISACSQTQLLRQVLCDRSRVKQRTARGWQERRLSAGLLIWDGPFLTRLNGSSSGDLYRPQVTRLVAPNTKQALPRLAATLPYMAPLWPAYLMYAIFGPPGIFKWEGLIISTYNLTERGIGFGDSFGGLEASSDNRERQTDSLRQRRGWPLSMVGGWL